MTFLFHYFGKTTKLRNLDSWISRECDACFWWRLCVSIPVNSYPSDFVKDQGDNHETKKFLGRSSP